MVSVRTAATTSALAPTAAPSAARRSPPRPSTGPGGTSHDPGRRGGGQHGRAVQCGPMIRRTFTAASVLSLLLCVAIVALWAISWVDGVTVCEGRVLAFHAHDPGGNFVKAME